MSRPTEIEARFADETGLFFGETGVPRIAGRMLGWLLVCDPPSQSLPDLTEALGISKASASTNVRLLVQLGLVERTFLAGDRRDYYRIADDAWDKFLHGRMAVMSALRRIAERGLRAIEGAPAARRVRLERMHRLYAFLEREFPPLVARFEAEEAARSSEDTKGGMR